MPKTCQSKIEKRYCHKRADALYPTSPYAKPGVEDCGGDISISLEIESGGCCNNDYCYCEPAQLQVRVRCTRCSCPYYEGVSDLLNDPLSELERILNG